MLRFLTFLGLTSVLATPLVAQCDPNLGNWTRIGDPIYRDMIPGANYQAASDGHIFTGDDGVLRMIYSGDDSDFSAIKLAKGRDADTWHSADTLLGQSTGQIEPLEKETAFYHRAPNGEHQIYFIGYADNTTYEASLYLATAPDVDGPYTVLPDPVIARGLIAKRSVQLITSPSVVTHNGLQHMVFLGWNGFEDVTAVWVFGATSRDNGRTWDNLGEVDVPIGMEGQLTPIPGGGYVATRTGEVGNTEGILIACADHPFGPYVEFDTPALIKAGAPWEVDEIIAPQITFDPVTGAPHLYYTGAEYARGWWMMRAQPAP